MELEPFFYYFVITKTLNVSRVKKKLAYLNQYSLKNSCQILYGTTISILFFFLKNVVVVLHIYGVLIIFLLFRYHQDTESVS